MQPNPEPSSSTESTESSTQQQKSVRFSRFERIYYTHSSVDYDRTSILAAASAAQKSAEESTNAFIASSTFPATLTAAVGGPSPLLFASS